jgi:probable HAF family extracellular repeat protein
MRTSVSVALFVGALCSSVLASAALPTLYRVTEFGADDSATQTTFVDGINNLGQATVNVFTATGAHPYLWQAGQLTPISNLDSVCGTGAGASANGINNLSQVLVQVSSLDGSCNKAVIWQGGKVVRVIGPAPTGYTGVFAQTLNDLDQVIGGLIGGANGAQPVFSWQNGNFTLLPVLPGGATGGPGGAEAAALSDLGVVVGTSGSTDGQRAVAWHNGAVTNLGVCPGYGNSGATGINNLGEVVGGCEQANFEPFLLQNGQLTVLPTPATGPQSALAGGINDFGQIVGNSEPTGGEPDDAGAALLWQGGAVYDLNTLIAPNDPSKPYIKLLASGPITDTGFILASGEDSRVPNTQAIQFILTPVR